jgi:phosphoenolpyruvate synthase/pyruvate phosphate dikinase
MKKYIHDVKTSIEELDQFDGGKATNMARLDAAGVNVPPWISLATPAFDQFLKLYKDQNLWILSHQEVEKLFVAQAIDPDLEAELRKVISEKFSPGCTFAVRSSGIGEDSADNSFAGLFSSYLHQTSIEQILLSIKMCWASAFTERARAYRLERGISTDKFGMGVIIQKMVFADVAGVGFSRNPIHHLKREQMIVSSVYGIGEGLVSGELDADHFYIQRPNETTSGFGIEPHLVKKEFYFVKAPNGGLEKQTVETDKQDIASLTDTELSTISMAMMKLEATLGLPQDIEWAFEKGEFFCVQTRPITNLPPEGFYKKSVKGAEFILWDNSNITESYNGVTTPLTFSHVSKAYRQVYLQYCEVMGVPADVIKANEITFRNMLGLIRGRVYYNLGNWYKMIFLFPFAGTSKGFMETMMGVKQNLRPELAALFDFTKNPPPYSFFRNIFILFRNLWRIFNVKKSVAQFKADFERVYSVAKKQDYDAKNIQELIAAYDQLNEDLLFKWKAPIISDTRCMLFFGILKSLTEKWIKKDNSPSLYNDLLSGQGDLPSTEPTRILMRIARKIDRGDSKFREWFITTPSKQVLAELRSGKEPEIFKDFNQFIDAYGFRCINELKLESIDLHEDPTFALEAIISFVRMKNTSVDEIIEREKETSANALKVVHANLGGPKLKIYLFILNQARVAVKDREDLRLLRTNVFGICRRIFKSLGRKFHEIKVIDEPMDIFYLSIDEISAFQEGRSFEVDFKNLAAVRKKQFEEYRNTPQPPDRFYTEGAVGANINFPQIIAEQDLLIGEEPVSDDPNVLIGTPCSPGIVEGIVRVVREAKDAEGLNGEIMVSERTDPGWVPLFPSTSGLLIERGSLLSHSAVVARELGIPTIVGVTGGLMKKLKTGMRVRMDASKGEIRILED